MPNYSREIEPCYRAVAKRCQVRRELYWMSIATVAALLVACRPVNQRSPPQRSVLAINFEPSAESDWVDQTAASDVGAVSTVAASQSAQIRIVSGHAEEKKVSKRIEASSFRQMRVFASIRTRFRPGEGSANTSMRLSVESAGNRTDAWNSATSLNTTGVTDTVMRVALDVPSDAAFLQIELRVSGAAEARFDIPQLEITATPPQSAPLTTDVLGSLSTLAQLIGYLRFFHPSDQVANTSWPTLEAEAVRRVLTAKSKAQVLDVLRWLVATVAPTASLREIDGRVPSSLPPKGGGTKLTRWVRIGSGNDGEPYSAFRTEIAEPSAVGITLLKSVSAHGCQHATLRLHTRAEQGLPVFELYIFPRYGSTFRNITSHIVSKGGAIDGDIPSGTTAIMFGVRIGGEGSVELTDIELSCDKKVIGSFSSIADAPEVFGDGYHLYTLAQTADCTNCISVTRSAETTYQPLRDELDVVLGLGMRLTMPLALWTDGNQTFPTATDAALELRPLPPTDLASRVASAIDIWTTLRWFYPYFNDLHIDWDRVLTESIAASACAGSADELLDALSHLVAGLHDDHASVYRADYDNGILPLLFHQIDSRLYFVGGIGSYKSVLPMGSTLESIDGVLTDTVVRQAKSTISAATPAWLHAGLPLVLADGPAGRMISIGARQPDGALIRIRVPRLARFKHFFQKHADRPANGSEIAPSIFYVNFGKLNADSWQAWLPKLASAKGIIGDTRDGASPAAFQVLAHLIDHEIKSPYWDKPIAHPTEKRYERSQSSILPLSPRLSAKIVFVVDGGTASSPETILQYAHAAGLGTVVGEPTGGTNGDVASFESLGGLSVRFTGTRTLNQDGSGFHGQGITPDLVVHPTAAGLREGRDEILEAAIARSTTP